jgi:hypothetical protein
VDTGLYQATALEAVAAIESIALSHRRVFLDPEIASDPGLVAGIDRLRSRRLRGDRTWRLVGAAALLLLVLKAIFGF